MSTRGAIARKTASGFRGVYHHNDGYPSGLGQELFQLRKKIYHGNTEAMLKDLIDKHPAGWSSIWGLAEGEKGICYCHGERSEKGWVVTEKNASGSGVEYAYVFSGDTMEIMASYTDIGAKKKGQYTEKMIGMFGSGDPKARWKAIAKINLNAKEPIWDSIQG